MKRRDPGKARGSGEPPPEVDLHRLSRAQAERAHGGATVGGAAALVIGRGVAVCQQAGVCQARLARLARQARQARLQAQEAQERLHPRAPGDSLWASLQGHVRLG